MGGAGTDTFEEPARAGSLLAGVRRLTLLADSADDGEEIFRGLARELLLAPGAEEVHVHRLSKPPVEDEPVVVYLFEGEGRLGYLMSRSERPAGVSSPRLIRSTRSSLPRRSPTRPPPRSRSCVRAPRRARTRSRAA